MDEGLGNATWVDELTAALAAMKAELAELGYDVLRDVIKVADITYETGIAEETIRKLFAGEHVAAEEVDLPFKERLNFLVRTRLREDGTAYKPAELAAAVKVSKQTVLNLLDGTRNPGFEVSKKLAEHFNVDPGFFNIRGDKALLKALEPGMRDARFVAGIKAGNVELVALRGSLAGGSSHVAQELQEVFETVMAAAQQASPPAAPTPVTEDDQELKELTETVRSLPPKKRKGVMSILRTLARMD